MPNKIIAGIDEVGRGCIVGPVIAAAVILDPGQPVEGLTDSKKLSEKKRLELAAQIKERCLAWAVGRSEASEIDRINIHQASLLAMSRAYQSLPIRPDWIKVDGKFFPPIEGAGEAIIGGDLLVTEISAASILAKTARDIEMHTLDSFYPGYKFSQHKGYPTRLHLELLDQLGLTKQHRKSFSPVKNRL